MIEDNCGIFCFFLKISANPLKHCRGPHFGNHWREDIKVHYWKVPRRDSMQRARPWSCEWIQQHRADTVSLIKSPLRFYNTCLCVNAMPPETRIRNCLLYTSIWIIKLILFLDQMRPLILFLHHNPWFTLYNHFLYHYCNIIYNVTGLFSQICRSNLCLYTKSDYLPLIKWPIHQYFILTRIFHNLFLLYPCKQFTTCLLYTSRCV